MGIGINPLGITSIPVGIAPISIDFASVPIEIALISIAFSPISTLLEKRQSYITYREKKISARIVGMSGILRDMTDTNPQTPQSFSNSGLRKRLFAMGAGMLSAGFALAQLKGMLDWIPTPVVGLLIIIPLLYFIFHLWTHEGVKKRRHLIYTHPVMSFIVLIVIGACIGAGVGFLAWWTTFRQERLPFTRQAETAQPIQEEVGQPEIKADEPKPNIIPVSYGKLHIILDPATQTFKEGDNGILVVVARFRNAHERSKEIIDANDIRAHIYYEPSEFYKNLDKTIPGFAGVDNGIWLDEKRPLVNFARGETKTLILAVDMGDGFGAFDYRLEPTEGGGERLLPRVPKLTADKYVVKVEITGGAHGDIDELYHFTITLRPEFNISFG